MLARPAPGRARQEESHVRLQTRRAKRCTVRPRALVSLAACAFLAALGTALGPAAARAAGAAGAAGSAGTGAAAASEESDGSEDVWVLQEFDWGDSPELVDESVRYSLPFTCNPMAGRCLLPVVEIDGEDLLVKFGYFEGLYRIAVLTPDLTRSVADVHAERVWRLLVDYITRHQGEPRQASAELPDFDSLSLGDTRFTHHWKLADQEIRVGIGRRGDANQGKLYVVASFFDPERAARRLESLRGGDAPPSEGAGAR